MNCNAYDAGYVRDKTYTGRACVMCGGDVLLRKSQAPSIIFDLFDLERAKRNEEDK